MLKDLVEDYRQRHRRQVDRFKHFIKHFSAPPIDLQSHWEDFEPVLARHREFREIGNGRICKYYFDKYLKHLRKKIDNQESGSEVEGPTHSSRHSQQSLPRSLIVQGHDQEEGELT